MAAERAFLSSRVSQNIQLISRKAERSTRRLHSRIRMFNGKARGPGALHSRCESSLSRARQHLIYARESDGTNVTRCEMAYVSLQLLRQFVTCVTAVTHRNFTHTQSVCVYRVY